MTWGDDNARDRRMGGRVEVEASMHFRAAGFVVERQPELGGADLRVFDPHNCRVIEVEVRCKTPTIDGRYGLEHGSGARTKREQWIRDDRYYVIKDHKRRAWYSARMSDLPSPEPGRAGSYCGGRWDPNMPNDYWPASCWRRLPWPYEAEDAA